MLIGYARVSKSDGSAGKNAKRPGLDSCLKALREGDSLVVWKLDRLGRSLQHLVNTVQSLTDKNIGLKVLTGKGANIDTTTSTGKLMFGFFAALAEFERDLIIERTKAGLESARAIGRKGCRRYSLTKSQITNQTRSSSDG